MPQVRTIYYAETNEDEHNRPPVLLIHGAGSDHRSWPIDTRHISGWRVLAVDLPGHGRSAGRPRQSVTAYAADLAGLLNELQIYRMVLVGHALGASVALQLALAHPDRLAGLGLISATAHLEPPDTLVEYFSNPLTIPLAIQMIQPLIFAAQTPAARIESGLAGLRSARPSVLAGDWQAFADYDLHASLKPVIAPAWVVTGSEDRLTPPAGARYLVSRLPSARLEIMTGASHMLPLEQPAALAAGLRAFLNQLSPLERKQVQLPKPP